MTPTTGENPPPGWYPDPHDRAQERYWDGIAWTDHRQPGPVDSPVSDDTAVLPRVEQPVSSTPVAASPGPRSQRRSGYGWVPVLVGLLVGLVVGVTAGIVVANTDGSSSPQSATTTGPPASTATATATATVTETTTATATVTETATATVTVTTSSSP